MRARGCAAGLHRSISGSHFQPNPKQPLVVSALVEHVDDRDLAGRFVEKVAKRSQWDTMASVYRAATFGDPSWPAMYS
jgi:hypothetical protein